MKQFTSTNRSFLCLWYTFAIVLGIGLLFKFMHWPGASWIVLFSVFALVCTMIYGIVLAAKKPADGISLIALIVMICGAIAFLFLVLRWPGGVMLSLNDYGFLLVAVAGIAMAYRLPEDAPLHKLSFAAVTSIPAVVFMGMQELKSIALSTSGFECPDYDTMDWDVIAAMPYDQLLRALNTEIYGIVGCLILVLSIVSLCLYLKKK